MALRAVGVRRRGPNRGGVPICFPGMVCVEAANALDESYTLKPGGSHTLATRITVA